MSGTISTLRLIERPGAWPSEVARTGADASTRPALAVAGKCVLDVVGAAVVLACATPLLVLIAVFIKLTSRGPAIFRQKRIGMGGRPFVMYKFRTMVDGAHRQQERLAAQHGARTFLKIVRDRRVTRLGRFLRKSSLDELPQLYNVLKGDMSLVGPRPLLACDFRKFPRDARMRRFSVKPGLTGLWQVSGRSLVSDEQRMRLDVEYVDHWSLRGDLGILARTVPAVLSGRGAT